MSMQYQSNLVLDKDTNFGYIEREETRSKELKMLVSAKFCAFSNGNIKFPAWALDITEILNDIKYDFSKGN